MTTTNDNAVWAYSNTGSLAHAFIRVASDGRLVAACRGNITREAEAILKTDEHFGTRLCSSCFKAWDSHLKRVERSMQPLQPCESFETYGAAPAPATKEDNYGSCEHCAWSGLLTKDGLMKQHRQAKDSGRTGTTGSLPQDKHAEICKGSGQAPYKPMHEAVNNAAPMALPQRPAYKTIVKVDTTWTLQSRRNISDPWSYVSDHGSEEAATMRAQAFLIEGSSRQFRVIEHRTEVKATDPIELPKSVDQGGKRYIVALSVDNRNAVMDTTTGTQVFSSWSRYPVVAMASDLNDGSVVVDPTGAIVQAPSA